VSRRSKAIEARLRAVAGQPLQRGKRIPVTAERVSAFRAEAVVMGEDPDKVEAMLRENDEVWLNDVYMVTVTRHAEGWVEHLSIKRRDRGPDIPWRDLQRMKSELAGDEAEAIEIFPAESRLVDTANQRWLWCFPPGEVIPRGFNNGRHVSGPEEAARLGAVQAPLA
jgi:hypothetical protein